MARMPLLYIGIYSYTQKDVQCMNMKKQIVNDSFFALVRSHFVNN